MTFLPPVFQLLLAAVVLIAAVTDIRSRRIPNWLVLMGTVFGVSMNWFAYGTPGLLSSLKGIGLALAIYFPLFLLRAMGAGDAKLMACVGSIGGPMDWFGIFVLSAAAGGALAIAAIITRGRIKKTAFNIAYILDELIHLRPPHRSRSDLDVGSPEAATLPHGVSIAVGSMLFLIASWIWGRQ